MNPLVLVVDDEPDVEVLFRQQFRRDLRTDRFTMEFAQSAPMALRRFCGPTGRSIRLRAVTVLLFHPSCGDDSAVEVVDSPAAHS